MVLKVRSSRGRDRARRGGSRSLLRCWIRCAPMPAGLLDGHRHAVDGRRRSAGARAVRGAVRGWDRGCGRSTRRRLPPVLEAATIAAEDRRFYSHPGVDPVSLLRAARHNLVEGHVVEGGSTITQQVAEAADPAREGVHRRGLRAKMREMVLALRLEHRFSKREVLAMYLNLAAYGNQATGAGRASQIYFGVDAVDADAGAGGVPRGAAAAADRVQPVEEHRVRARAAADGPPPHGGGRLVDRPSGCARRAPSRSRCARGRRRSTRRTSSRWCRRRRTRPRRRRHAHGDAHRDDARPRSAARGRRASSSTSARRCAAHGAANVAVVVLDNARGEWLAWEGSGDYGDAEHGGTINGPLVPRQPGSALKPFTYALAFEQGRSPASVLPDIPSHFPTAEPGVLYSPRNYDGQYRGPLLARRALAGSENVPGGRARVRRRRQHAAALPRPRRPVDLRSHARVLRARRDAGERRGAARRARRRLRDRSRAAACGASRRSFFRLKAEASRLKPGAQVVRLDGDDRSSARAPRSGSPTSSATRGARLHLRARQQPRVPVPGGGEDRHVAGVPRQLDRSATRATSPSACGSATSIARRCACRPASPAPARSSTR